MKKILLAVLLLSGCVFGDDPPTAEQCHEFNYSTEREHIPVTCRILWCGKGTGQYMAGGPTMLWCDPTLK